MDEKEEGNDPNDNKKHHFDDMDSEIYLTEEEHNLFAQEDESNKFDLETEQYQIGYENVVNDFQRNLNLRSRDVVVNKGRLHVNQPSSNQ